MVGAILITPYSPPNAAMWKVLMLIFCAGIIYRCIIRTWRYRVILIPDGIELANLIATKRVLRQDITGYKYEGGRLARLILLYSKNRSSSRLSIPIAFDLDDDFCRWVNAFPCLDDHPLEGS